MGKVTISTEEYDKFKEQERVLNEGSVLMIVYGYADTYNTVLNADDALKKVIDDYNKAVEEIILLREKVDELNKKPSLIKKPQPYFKFWK